ncbi:hypothetical protein [Alloactinosynnema sp. L-07]|nr:hypothetical protein [Alloactinosynnema sp. L-07]
MGASEDRTGLLDQDDRGRPEEVPLDQTRRPRRPAPAGDHLQGDAVALLR